MAWEFNDREPVYIQLENRILRDIFVGKYKPEEQIPPVRMLAIEAAVNPNTMQRALSELESMGVIETRGTIGRFVTSDTALIDMMRYAEVKKLVDGFIASAKDYGLDREKILRIINESERWLK